MADTTAAPPAPVLYGPDGVAMPPSGMAPRDPYPIEDIFDRFRQYPSRNLTAQRLINILDLADMGELDLYFQLCEEVLEKEVRIGSAFATRKAAITGIDYTIMPADESPEAAEIADMIDSSIDETLLRALVNDLMDAIAFPLVVEWITWDVVDGMNVPVAFRKINRRLRWNPLKDEILMIPTPSSAGVPFQPWTTLRALSPEKYGHPTRAGLMRSIIWIFYLKQYGMKDWAGFIERFGKPWPIARVPMADFNNPNVMAKVKAALRDIGANASGIFPVEPGSQQSAIDLVQAAGASGQRTPQDLYIDYLDRCVGNRILGHELAAMSAKGQGQLGITAAMEVRGDILDSDSLFVGPVIRRDLFIPMVGFNRGWDKIRLAPRISFLYEEPADKGSEATAVSILAKTFPKLGFSKSQLQERFDLLEPIDEEDTVYGSAGPTFPMGPTPGVAAPGATPTGAPADDENQPDKESPEPIDDGASSKPSRVDAAGRRPTHSAKSRVDLPVGSIRHSAGRVSRIVDRGKSDARPSLVGLAAPLRKIVADGVKAGKDANEILLDLASAYPKMNSAGLKKAVYQALVLSRTYGRVSSPK